MKLTYLFFVLIVPIAVSADPGNVSVSNVIEDARHFGEAQENRDQQLRRELRRLQRVFGHRISQVPVDSPNRVITEQRIRLDFGTAINDLLTQYQSYADNSIGGIVGSFDRLTAEEQAIAREAVDEASGIYLLAIDEGALFQVAQIRDRILTGIEEENQTPAPSTTTVSAAVRGPDFVE